MTPALLVIAKAPVPGRVKTRLCPPCTPEQAARLAAAALEDTLAAVARRRRARRRVLVLDGGPAPWLPPGFEVVPQRGDGPRRSASPPPSRTSAAPALLVGMDTPQVTPALLDAGPRGARATADAVFGPATTAATGRIGLRSAGRARSSRACR